jgi:predicted kinase
LIKERIKRFLDMNSVEVVKVAKDQDASIVDHISEAVTSESANADDRGSNKKARVSLAKSVMIVMVGLPGAGKTSFGEKVKQARGAEDVVRLCQDEIGKPECERQAHFAMEDGGKLVLIDRTNLTKDQRAIWIKIAQRYESPCIALHFKVDVDVCIDRALKRRNHPTLEGNNVHRVVNTLIKTKQDPSISEGFARVLLADDDATKLDKELEEHLRLLRE